MGKYRLLTSFLCARETIWPLHTNEGLSLLPEAVFGCSHGLSAGCSGGVRVRGQWRAGSRDGLGDGQKELNVIV